MTATMSPAEALSMRSRLLACIRRIRASFSFTFLLALKTVSPVLAVPE